jgi:predicted MFS family arabinose efflux permease
VLVALAIGYSVGGKIADRYPHPSGLAKIVLVAAALLAAVPFIADPFLPLAVKAVDQLSIATFAVTLLVVFGFNQLLSAEPPTCQAAAGTSSVSVVLTEGVLS